jgi:hypothetical protein
MKMCKRNQLKEFLRGMETNFRVPFNFMEALNNALLIDKLRLECKTNAYTDLQARGPGPTVLHKDVPHGPVNCCARRLLNSHADFTGKGTG